MKDLVLVCGMSRSGTTLLTTILDSHPDISMAYELMPAGLPSPGETQSILRDAVQRHGDEAEQCGRAIKAEGQGPLGTFVRRCGRSLVPPSALIEIVDRMSAEGSRDLNKLPARVQLSALVADRKRAHEGTSYAGFKMNAPSVGSVLDVAPDARLLYILRDPRDVAASHFANDFGRDIPHITRAWENYTQDFVEFARRGSARTALIRYEDLVTEPDGVLKAACEGLELEFDEAMLRFFDSKASVHQHGHNNAENLSRDFFRTSVDRWQTDLAREQIAEIERTCGRIMTENGYHLMEELPPLDPELVQKMATTHKGKRKYFRDEYERLLEPFLADYVNLTWQEAAKGERDRGADIFIVRHDIDHDLYNALRIARWEHDRGVRATYCVLHTAWYYGRLEGGRMQHSRDMVEVCREIQDLGHEINLHNNVPVTVLKEGVDAVAFLKEELAFLRGQGLRISGSSTHGDALCRELDFRNYELFSESVYESRGGRRTVEHNGNAVKLGAVSMADFGLEYEAYDIPRDFYMTDSGGNLRTRSNTRARAGLRRSELPDPLPYGRIVGLLTHPIWWDFEQEAPVGREFTHYEWPGDSATPSELHSVQEQESRGPRGASQESTPGPLARLRDAARSLRRRK